MTDRPLVSVGVPTFNRPEALKRALMAIVNQTYSNLEIIVSDNCSDNPGVRSVIDHFGAIDPRIRVFYQPSNIGAAANFFFVLKKATGMYFMWAADDDEWQGPKLLEELMVFAPHNVLTFPEATTVHLGKVSTGVLSSFSNCMSKEDYIKAFCLNDVGYPFYGIYNLSLMSRFEIGFDFDMDMNYHSDGLFLHRILISGPVKFVPHVSIKYNAYGSLPSVEAWIDSWPKYITRTIKLYLHSSLSTDLKSFVLELYINRGVSHFRNLLSQLAQQKGSKKSFKGSPSRFDVAYARFRRYFRGK